MRPQERYSELRHRVRQICGNFPNEYWRKLDEHAGYPTEFVQTLTQAGFLGALIPQQYGGAGVSLAEASVILEEINRSGGNAATCHAQMYIMGALLRHGTEQQKQKYLPSIAEGTLRLQAFAVTEPDAGTDTTQIRTKAEKQSDGSYKINGQKIWTSRAEHSDLMLLLTRTTPLLNNRDSSTYNNRDNNSDSNTDKNTQPNKTSKTAGLSLFLVELKDLKGLTIKPIKTMINHHTTQVWFDDVVVDGSSLIGEEGMGFKYLLDGLNAERILIAAECIGDSYWFIDQAVDYAKNRTVFKRKIGQNQGIQFPISQVYCKTSAADLMRFHAADRFDLGHSSGPEANMAKLLAADVSFEAANVAVQTFGGNAFACDYDIERKFRETRLYQVAPVSTNLILSYIAEHVLRLPKSY